jgi:hypothetical protein
MIVCFACGGFIDVRDRFCRYCGRTVIFDKSEPSRPYAVVSPSRDMKKTAATAGVQGDLCRHCQKAVKPTNPERSVIGRVLTQAIFHDDEEELNDALDL